MIHIIYIELALRNILVMNKNNQFPKLHVVDPIIQK